jgi:hypothetical protein
MESDKLLMIGVELKDLAHKDRNLLSNYRTIVRPYMRSDSIQRLVGLTNPSAVVVRQPSGGVYLYSPGGRVLARLGLANEQKRLATEQAGLARNGPLISARAARETPYPGANVPEYLYPGISEGSYLPGEGDPRPPYQLSEARKTVQGLSAFGQRNFFPLFFQSNLNTNASLGNALAGDSVEGDSGFPSLELESNSSANAAAAAGQIFTVGVGFGATALDAILSGQELEYRQQQAERDARGTAYYEFPREANTYYQPLPESPSYYYY